MVACVIAAIAALLLGYLAACDLYLTGFPDGHLTDYDKAVDTPKQILKWVEFGFAPLFLILAFSPIGTRKRAVGLARRIDRVGPGRSSPAGLRTLVFRKPSRS